MAAMCLGRTQTAVGTFCFRLAFSVGQPKAITATAANSPRLYTAR
jgi:hypothetical protein